MRISDWSSDVCSSDLRHVAAHQGGIDLQEGAADVLSEGEVALPVAAVEVVVENAADAACLAAVGNEEVLVAALLEAGVEVGGVAVAGVLPGGVAEIGRGAVRGRVGQ